jgi:hypothetical protein
MDEKYKDRLIKYSFFMINNDINSMKASFISNTFEKSASILYLSKLQDEMRRANPD